MKKEFIVNRQGKDFCLYAGLLDQAHAEGLKRISTTLVQIPNESNGNLAIVIAEVETEKGIFTGIGDASPQNVGRMIALHCIRMAETRAKARALRDAINVGATAVEELGPDEADDPAPRRVVNERTGELPYRPAPSTPEPPPAAATEPNLNDVATVGDINRLRNLLRQLEQTATIPPTLTHGAALVWLRELAQEFNARAKR